MFSITLYGWVLFLHLLSAFALVGGLTLFVVAQVAARRTDLPAVAQALGRIVVVGTTGLRAGLIGTVVFGVWLVLIVNGYSILDGWILAALALWVVTGALGDRSVVVFRRATRLAGDLVSRGDDGPSDELAGAYRRGSLLVLRISALVFAVAVLALMVWKPGA